MRKGRSKWLDSFFRDADPNDEISVDMDGKYETASPPNWLVTEGVGSCIAVAVASKSARRAWLVHAPNFHIEASGLLEMLHDASLVAPSGDGLQVWVVGGVPAEGCESEGERDRSTVQGLVKQMLPHAKASYEWSECERIDLIFAKGRWHCIWG